MPTGYTSGILDGKINTFEEFATVCTRAFGATIHMKDDSLDSPYEPRTPSLYHLKAIQEKKEELEKYNTLSDEDLLVEMKKGLNEDLVYYKGKLEESTRNLEKLNSMLESAKSWIPPTEDHEAFRTFMIDQLEMTIKHDGDSSYYVEKIMEVERELGKEIDLKAERKSKIKELKNQISYHEIEHQKDFDRCQVSNDWVNSVLESIKK
jgi:hypothetical protein